MDHAFFAMRKHLAWYCRGFDGARELRAKLMQTNSATEVETILLH
jgi:tRNA-dihydrouridine synthase